MNKTLTFRIERRGDIDVLVYNNSGCRPATSPEVELWNALLAAQQPEPIDMLLFCPKCGMQHVDAPENKPGRLISSGPFAGRAVAPEITWENPPHRSHLCHACGTIWRPADVPTNGVASIGTRGKADTWDGKPEPRAEVTDDDKLCARRYRWLSRQVVATHSRDDLNCRWEVDYVLYGESFDAAIDAARAGEGQ